MIMKKISYLKLLAVVFMVLTFINFIPNYTNEIQKDSEKGLKNNGSWDLTGTPIVIDGNAEWVTTAATEPWCNGSGIWNDPYILENITIDGNNLTSCITIKNSDVYFRIENCKVFNSSSGFDNAGINLDHSNNGTLIGNNCSNNNGNGIRLSYSQNITISGNTANNNVMRGISLSVSHNNNLSGNTFNENSNGVALGISNNNTISENSAFNNDWRGIYLTNDNINNTVINNNISYNKEGILVSDSHNNTFIGNNADHNEYGIWVWKSNNSIIIGNTVSYTDLIGLWLYKSNNTDVMSNTFVGNIYKDIEEVESENNNFKFNYNGGIFSPFIIDDDGGGDFTWSEIKALFFWCTGSGSYSDPYFIQNLIIDGQNLSSCIEIRDSTVFFKIYGCTLYNSGSGVENAGIKLSDVINGQLIDNDCSNNNGVGIRLIRSQNITVSGNTVNNNVESGLRLSQSHNNNFTGNTLNENSNGMLLLSSKNNTISENSAFNNDQRGIYLSSLCNNNTFINNNLSYNEEGIFVSDSHNNTFIGNNAEHNDYGIWVWNSNNSTIIGNNVSYTASIGLWLYKSNNTDVIGNVFNGNLYKNIEEFECENNNIKFNYYDGIFSPVIIDDDGGGDFTWLEAKALFFWCTGSGSYSDPYIIQNLIIDGQNLSSCIEIRDSIVFFKIEGCTLYNSGSGLYNAGIKLSDVIIGQLINNDCSNNNGVGIGLYQSQNVTIDGNIVNINVEFGIFLEGSHNNNLSGNILNENSNGVYLGLSNNNTISENSAFNNDLNGIYLSSLSNNNTIMNNNVNYNGNNGIDIYDSHEIKVVGNIADHNGWNGIFIWSSNNATVAKNTASYNTNAGLYLWSSNNTEVIGNVFNGNLYSIYESESENNSFSWNVNNGFITSIIIDDTGTGDFTWVESVNQLAWIYGSGTLIDPYIIEFITIDGLNLTSCLTIRNSNVNFRVQNCTFYNSGYNLYDGGIILISTSYGELIYNNCSFNNANGILLEDCEYIDITSSTINNNTLNGILLIDSSYINILDNTNTINSNSESGIYLLRSHNNEISGNIIRYNSVGINLDESNDNLIDRNTLLGNGIAILNNGENNNIGDGNILPEGTGFQFPFETLLIILIVGIVAVGIAGSVIIRKRIISSRGVTGKREISEQKKEKVQRKLEEKLKFVDYLIKESNFKIAYKNLGNIKDTADKYELMAIFNKAVKKTKYCQEVEAGITKAVITEDLTKSVKEKKVKGKEKTIPVEKIEVKEEVVIKPVIEKEDESRYKLFISYSTSDRDYFQIENIVKELKKYPYINQISYWERDSKANIVEFMEETLEVSNIFVLFCSENTAKSKAVRDEWQAAYQMRKEDLIKIIPVYEEQKYIPKVLWHLLNVKYDRTDFNRFIENLYNEIKRE